LPPFLRAKTISESEYECGIEMIGVLLITNLSGKPEIKNYYSIKNHIIKFSISM
jgi:hypothetical protein